ncbi:MAG: hypothetical protein LBU07_03195 [Coriobacteriales bacterium]|jgi:hypothetical protein|nr:hypothetical protein [Coriobacteriales bacterium]
MNQANQEMPPDDDPKNLKDRPGSMRVVRRRPHKGRSFLDVLRSYLAVAVTFTLFILALVAIVVLERFIIG